MPLTLTKLIEGLLPAQLTALPELGEWSARDMVAHLRACADIWGRYIMVILTEDKPTFKAINPTAWIKKTNYRQIEFKPSLQAFAAQRAELLKVLMPLAPDAWSRTVIVTGTGKPRERIVYTYAQWLANHERSHIRQVKNIVNTIWTRQLLEPV